MRKKQKDETNKATINEQVALAKKQGANLLIPTTSIHGLSEFMSPVIESVVLSAKPDDGDVYAEKATEGTKFRITAQGLRKLAVCAGIIWHPTACRRTDNRQDRDYVSYQSVGGIKKNDGSLVYWKGEFDLDFEVIEEELRELHYNKSKHWRKTDAEKQAYIESSVRRDMIFKRKHKIKLAETGAANRVIRAILGLKSAYTSAELAKPFTLIRIVFKPDYNDPEVKRQVTAAAISSMTGIYGVPAALPPQEQPIDISPEDFHNIPSDPDEDQPGDDNSDPDDDQPGGDNEETSPTAEELFQDLSATEQVEMLSEIVKRKGYKPKQPIENLNKKERLTFLGALEKLTDLDAKDDIPY